MQRASIASGVLVAVLCLVVGCGGSGDPSTSTSTAAETPQPLPKLPAGWRAAANRTQGFAFGLPPGWRSREAGSGASLLRTPDRRIAMSIAADRTDEAVSQPLASYARGAVESLGLRRVKIASAAPLKHRYHAVEVRAAGIGAGGVRERAQLVALRRDRTVSIVAVAVRRAAVPERLYGRQVVEIVRTLRSRPVS